MPLPLFLPVVRKSVPLRTVFLLHLFIFVNIKIKFTDIFVNILTFTNKYDIILLKGGREYGKQNLLLCKSIKQGTEP